MAGLIDEVKRRALKAGARAVQEIVSSERGSAAVASAVRRVQESREKLDEQSRRIVNALGLATRADLERVSRRVAKLKKRLVGLLDTLA